MPRRTTEGGNLARCEANGARVESCQIVRKWRRRYQRAERTGLQ